VTSIRHPWPRGLARDDVDHVLVVVSDIEMGIGGATDDCADTAFMEELLSGYQEPPYDGVAVTFVFNGDTFDFLKTPCADGSYPTHVSESMSVSKLDRIAEAHPSFFDTLRRLLTTAEAPRKVVFVAGNHDQDLFFEGVQSRLGELVGAPESLVFPGLSWRCGDVLIEHGSQHDPTFAIDPERPLVEHEGQALLNLPWGTLAIIEVVTPHLPLLHPLDRLRPHRAVLDAFPEVRELLLNEFWRYWTHDYWARFFQQSDPLRQVTWTMLSQVGYRFGTGDPDLRSPGGRVLRSHHPDARTVCMGHLHEARLESRDDQRLLQTGCFRNEYLADLDGGDHRLLQKTYAEVFLHEGRTRRSRLVDVDAPAPSFAVLPRNLAELTEHVRTYLEPFQESEEQRARDEQSHTERRSKKEVSPGFIRTLWHALGEDR